MPLPTPRPVMSSPSHMITEVPAVIVITSVAIRNRLVSGMIVCVHDGNSRPERASATMPVDCSTARTMVR